MLAELGLLMTFQLVSGGAINSARLPQIETPTGSLRDDAGSALAHLAPRGRARLISANVQCFGRRPIEDVRQVNARYQP